MDFYLSQLDFGVTASSATISGETSQAFSGDAIVDVNVYLSVVRNMFNFQTDSTDITDASDSDIKYRVVYTPADPILPFDIEPDSNTTVTSSTAIDSGAANNAITYDYVRYLALKLFNTHLGVDLFDNETELRTHFNSEFKSQLNTKLVALDAEGVLDATGNSASETILSQIMHIDKSRLTNLSQYAISDNWYKMPVRVNDKLYFLLTVTAATNQNTLTGVDAIPNRTYLMRLTIVLDP